MAFYEDVRARGKKNLAFMCIKNIQSITCFFLCVNKSQPYFVLRSSYKSRRIIHDHGPSALCMYVIMPIWKKVQYGNEGCGVFKRWVQNQKGFCLRINILKGNYLILRIALVGASEVLKNQCFKSQLFSSSHKKQKYLKFKSWLDFNAIIVFLLIR